MPKEYPKCPGESIRILYNRRRRVTNCYQRQNEHGWCGTCNSKSEEGKRGHCPIGVSADNSPRRENTIVKLDANWGFCSKLCTDLIGMFPKRLQETKITIMRDKECELFADEESGLEYTAGMCSCNISFMSSQIFKTNETSRLQSFVGLNFDYDL